MATPGTDWPAPGPARVSPVEPGSRPELAAIEQRILAERGRISPLYQVLLNSAPIAAGWEQMLTAVRNRTTLPAALRELAILRMAVLNRAAFEYDAHVPHALRAGLAETQIAGTRESVIAADLYTPVETMVLELTDAMTRDVEAPDAPMARVQVQFVDRGLVELVATVAAYNMVSRLLVALRVGH